MFLFCGCVFFFFKQKTAYEMRISDWSSDVCSSDLHLLVLFAGVMIVVGLSMLRGKSGGGDPDVRITRPIAVRLVVIGVLAGLLSGFFGIGGGFLIVPGIMLGSGMPILNAVGSSLFSVGAFGSATAFNYALSGRSEEHPSELQSLMRISYAVSCLKKK